MPSKPPFPSISLQHMLGRVLADLRARKKLDQAELARQLGMSAANLSRIETGHANLTVEQLFYACRVLDLEPSQMIRLVELIWRDMEDQGVKVLLTKMPQESTGRGYIEVAGDVLKEVMQPLLGRRFRSEASWWSPDPHTAPGLPFKKPEGDA